MNQLTRTTVQQTLEKHGRPISDQTVRKRLKEGGLQARRPYIRMVLSARHRQFRLAWEMYNRADWG